MPGIEAWDETGVHHGGHSVHQHPERIERHVTAGTQVHGDDTVEQHRIGTGIVRGEGAVGATGRTQPVGGAVLGRDGVAQPLAEASETVEHDSGQQGISILEMQVDRRRRDTHGTGHATKAHRCLVTGSGQDVAGGPDELVAQPGPFTLGGAGSAGAAPTRTWHAVTVAKRVGAPMVTWRRAHCTAVNSLRPAWLAPMRPRRPDEEHRTATPLELLFDLCFVVAVAQTASSLHLGLSASDTGHALWAYPMVFFAIWWAWLNFTWFASAYDSNDVPYRLATFVQIAGALILAAGVADTFESRNFTTVTVGFAVMRVGLIAQWLRAAHADPRHRRSACRSAAGLAACQLGWITLLALPEGSAIVGFVALVALELAVPVWAERAENTTWNPQHMAERFGLFTLIVLGGSVLVATNAIWVALDSGSSVADIAPTAAGGLLIICSLWWIYFEQPSELVAAYARFQSEQASMVESFVWGYGHYFVFSSAAAVGGGLAVAADQAVGANDVSSTIAGLTVAIPVSLYLLAVRLLHARRVEPGLTSSTALATALILVMALSWSPQPVLAVGIVLAGLVVQSVISQSRTGPFYEQLGR